MKILVKYLVIGLLLGTSALPAMEKENYIDERLISSTYDALMVLKEQSLKEVLNKLRVTIKNLYATYEDGGRSDENLKGIIIKLTSNYLALKKMDHAL